MTRIPGDEGPGDHPDFFPERACPVDGAVDGAGDRGPERPGWEL